MSHFSHKNFQVIEDPVVPEIAKTKHLEPLEKDNVEELEPPKDVGHKTMNDVESKMMKDEEELNLVKDIEEVKSKLREFELKLSEVRNFCVQLTNFS